jgi:hypothetical protein
LFEEQVEKHLPAYGGCCAYGVAHKVLFPEKIDTWEIIDGRLVLQYSEEVKQKFGRNKAENIRNANENWSKIEEERSK